MSELQCITESSDTAFTQAAMRWLQALVAAQLPPSTPAPAPPADEHDDWQPALEGLRRLFGRWGDTRPPEPQFVPAGARPPADTATARQARAALEQAARATPAPRFSVLCDLLGLLPFERDLLLLCLGHAISPALAQQCARAPESAAGAPTFALALRLAADPWWESLTPSQRESSVRLAAAPDWGAMAPDRPLRAWDLIEITQPGAQPLLSSLLRADERIVNHLLGRDYLDDRIATFCRALPPAPAADELSDSQRQRLAAGKRQLLALVPLRERLLVQLPGGDSATKRLYARWIAAELGLRLHLLPLEQLPSSAISSFARYWNRERHMQRIALLIDATRLGAEGQAALHQLLDRAGGVLLLDHAEPLAGHDSALLLDAARPTPAEQQHAWAEQLGDGEWPEQLAAQFSLNRSEIAEISRAAAALAVPAADAHGLDADARAAQLAQQGWELCRGRARPQLDGLAQRISSSVRLDSVQLPHDEKRALEQIRDQTRHRARVYDGYGFRERLPRGLGISALFAGPSGTGKTMAAEAIANELELDLYRIDLASVVSKYIGETEKNLKRVFDVAEQSGAVLLFDEADALFGKRSEVKDSHDRYANIEVSYLLQRMEAYEGLAVLTSNMKSALDPAFLRRLRFIVSFPFPGVAEREQIWRGAFPPGVPGVLALDFRALARPSLTGGQIRNIALNAAFLAAAGKGVVTPELLHAAARDELRKSGRPLVEADYAAWKSPKELAAREA